MLLQPDPSTNIAKGKDWTKSESHDVVKFQMGSRSVLTHRDSPYGLSELLPSNWNKRPTQNTQHRIINSRLRTSFSDLKCVTEVLPAIA